MSTSTLRERANLAAINTIAALMESLHPGGWSCPPKRFSGVVVPAAVARALTVGAFILTKMGVIY